MKTDMWHRISMGSAVFFAGFSTAHLIDDFLYEVPAEFHLTEPVALLLALLYMVALVGLIAAAAQRSQAGYRGLFIAGILIALAQLLKSAPEILRPGPWHSGAPSELLALGLGVSAATTALASIQVLRNAKREDAPPL